MVHTYTYFLHKVLVIHVANIIEKMGKRVVYFLIDLYLFNDKSIKVTTCSTIQNFR